MQILSVKYDCGHFWSQKIKTVTTKLQHVRWTKWNYEKKEAKN